MWQEQKSRAHDDLEGQEKEKFFSPKSFWQSRSSPLVLICYLQQTCDSVYSCSHKVSLGRNFVIIKSKNISCLQRTLLQFRFPLKTFAIPTLRRLLCILNLSIFLGKVACNIKLSLAWMDHHENKKWLLQFQIPGSGVSISGTISLSRSVGVSGLQ